jgi:arylsulfatase
MKAGGRSVPGRDHRFQEADSALGAPITFGTLAGLDEKGWELYHVEKDFAENHNVAAQHRARLTELITQWYVEAGKYDVLPIDGRLQARLTEERPQLAKPRDVYTYYPGTQTVPQNASVKILNRAYSITAEVEVPEGGAQGVLISAGGVDGGYSMYMKNDLLNFDYNYVAAERFHLESDQPVPAGKHQLRFEFEPTGKPDILKGKGAPGIGRLYIDGRSVGRMELPLTTPLLLGLAGGIHCGADTGAPVTDAYTPPFNFTGKLSKVIVDVSGKLFEDKEAQMREVMARQ